MQSSCPRRPELQILQDGALPDHPRRRLHSRDPSTQHESQSCRMSHSPPAASRQSVRASTLTQASARCPLSWLQSARGALPSPAGQLLAAGTCHPCTSQCPGWARRCGALNRPAPSRTARSSSRWRGPAVSAAGNVFPAANSSLAWPPAEKVHASGRTPPIHQLRLFALTEVVDRWPCFSS